MLHFEFSKCDEEVYLDLIQDTKICQPENCGYYLYEVLEGAYLVNRCTVYVEILVRRKFCHLLSLTKILSC